MEETIYQNRIVHRGTLYILRIIKRQNEYLVNLSLENGENLRELSLSSPESVDMENYSAYDIFSEVIEAEERWIKDNR